MELKIEVSYKDLDNILCLAKEAKKIKGINSKELRDLKEILQKLIDSASREWVGYSRYIYKEHKILKIEVSYKDLGNILCLAKDAKKIKGLNSKALEALMELLQKLKELAEKEGKEYSRLALIRTLYSIRN